MKKQIQPLSKTEIIKLDSVIAKIRYAVKRANISATLSAGYCKVSLRDFNNDKVVLEIESKVEGGVELEIMTLDRKNMQPITHLIEFNPENN